MHQVERLEQRGRHRHSAIAFGHDVTGNVSQIGGVRQRKLPAAPLSPVWLLHY